MRVEFVTKLNRFPQASGLLKQAVGRAFQSVSQPILSDMQQQTPVETGGLRDSERVEVTESTMTFRAGEGLPDIRAIAVHQGTPRMAARPYMRNAVEGAIPAITNAITDEASGVFQ